MRARLIPRSSTRNQIPCYECSVEDDETNKAYAPSFRMPGEIIVVDVNWDIVSIRTNSMLDVLTGHGQDKLPPI